MIIACILLLAINVLCFTNIIKITKKHWVALWSLIIPHIYLICVFLFKQNYPIVTNIIFTILFVMLSLFILIKYNIFPFSEKRTEDIRLNTLVGGRRLIFTSLYAALINIIFFIFAFKYAEQLGFQLHFIITDLIISISFVLLLFLNGFWRITILSRRLNIIKRVVFVFMIWVPIVNIVVAFIMCHAAKVEYDHELYKINQNQWRIESKKCNTKYPLIMLHGVGFKDLKYLNYWGRIPKELVKNGAKVYYGNQEAWGTIEDNAADVKKKILEIVEETGADKVNIIAHSKGGLDARYMISKLEMEDYVASLTTISTPHRGSFILDFAYKLPAGLVRLIGKMINKYFRTVGDKNPNFEVASKQFLTENAKKFNEEVIDSEKVYYQSYASVMSHAYSDYILFVPFIIGRCFKEENDGLVSPSSAQWGEFRGVIRTKTPRGISHGDMIDLRRNDYKGFDVREFYVDMVAELKDRGF
ncbi:MAG: alpha/beta fold hydrolase [Eubacteriales bacterium]